VAGAAKLPDVELRRASSMNCPHCNREIDDSTAALADHAYMLRARCEKCGKEFLIVESVAMTEEKYTSQLRTDSKQKGTS